MSASGAWVFSARLHGPENGDRRPHQRRRRANHGRAVAESKEHLACFYMVDAEDLDSAPAGRRKVSEAIDRPIEVRPFAGFSPAVAAERRDLGTSTVTDAARVGQVFREEWGRSVAALIRILGDIDLVKDAVQDAFAIAMRRWPREGLPPNPGGWITTTARNQAIDRLRRESRGRELLAELALLAPGDGELGTTEEEGPVEDDRLRLIFTCCHPALSGEAQVALTLRLLGGISTEEVASAFLVAEPTMATRLVRAKRKVKAARIPYGVPDDHDLPSRLPRSSR